MIRTIDVDINAANPSMPLAPLTAFATSPSSLRIRNVPRKIGDWALTAVSVSVAYPDNSVTTKPAKLVGGVWVVTVPGCATIGTSGLGYSVLASGTDENNAAISGYILGKGDVVVLNADGTITADGTSYYVHIVDSMPTTPHKGDLCKVDGNWKLYTGSAWDLLGGGVTDYDALTNRPQIGGVTLTGNKTLADLSAVATNDPRLTDSRTPTAHAASHAAGGSDAVTPAAIGAANASHTHAEIVNGNNKVTANADIYRAGESWFVTLSNGWSLKSGSFAPYFHGDCWQLGGDAVLQKEGHADIGGDSCLNTSPDPAATELTQFYYVENDPPYEWIEVASGAVKTTAPVKVGSAAVLPTSGVSSGALLKSGSDGVLAAAVAGTDYLNQHQDISGKQDTISDLATIRSGAALGASSVQSFASVGGQTPSVTAGVADLSSLFGGANTSLATTISTNSTVAAKADASALRYATAAATTDLADRTCNAVEVTSSAVTLAFPAAVEGKMRDFLVYIDATDFAEGGALTINLPSGAAQYGDDFPAVAAAGEHLIAVTEIAANSFFVKALEIEEVA